MHREFAVHKLNDVGIAKASQIAQEFDKLLGAVEQICPEGRELSIVKTKLEEASFFAKKSIALDPAYQED
jgi:hypothetical protein